LILVGILILAMFN